MATLEATMKKHNISIDPTSSSSSHGHALFASGFSFNTPSTSTSDKWLIDSGASYHMAKDRDIFSTLNECNTKKIFVGDDRSLGVEGSGTIQVENDHFNDVLCVPSLSCNFLSVYQITHSGEGITVEFSPHQVVIKDLKDPNHVLAIGIVDDITRLYKFDNFGSSSFSSVFVAHSDDLSKLWHEWFGHLNYNAINISSPLLFLTVLARPSLLPLLVVRPSLGPGPYDPYSLSLLLAEDCWETSWALT
jgi:hypothetical protein